MTTFNTKNAAIQSSVNLRRDFAASHGTPPDGGDNNFGVDDLRIDDIKFGFTNQNREFFSAATAILRADANGGDENDHRSENGKKKKAEQDRERAEELHDIMMARIESDIQDMQISLREIDEQIEQNRIDMLRIDRRLMLLSDEETETAENVSGIRREKEQKEAERDQARAEEEQKEREARDAQEKVDREGDNASDADREDARKKEEARRDAARKREQKDREVADTERRLAEQEAKQREQAAEREKLEKEKEEKRQQEERLQEDRSQLEDKLQEKLRQRAEMRAQEQSGQTAGAPANSPDSPAAEAPSGLRSQFKAAHDAPKPEIAPSSDQDNQKDYVAKQTLSIPGA